MVSYKINHKKNNLSKYHFKMSALQGCSAAMTRHFMPKIYRRTIIIIISKRSFCIFVKNLFSLKNSFLRWDLLYKKYIIISQP